jgi:crotonobetainyl-CoA:carnitine CoA-transferase CaiB-like acyl-CoA transferase
MPLSEGFLPVLGEWILDYTMNGRVAPPQGNSHPSHAPHDIFPCAGDDQWIAIDVATDEEFTALCDVLGAAELASDERLATQGSRWQHRDVLDASLAELTRPRDKTELFHALQSAGVIAGPLMTELDALASPQLEARDWFEEITREDLGTHRYPGLLFKMRNTPNHVRRPPPKLGEHNEEVYLDMLGYSREEYDALVAKGLVGTTYDPAVLPQRTEF